MKNKHIKSSKFIIAPLGITLGIIGFVFTQIWFILGAGIALSIASLVID